ncbi:MAG TPA: radical SAM protein [Hyphomicrobiales bacterium]|nr:radical SAM protein [Hyphomicrobiales bacterium]
MRKNVLIVNAFFDEYRRMGGSPHRVPRSMGPIYLAGAFEPNRCEVRIHNEQYSGVLDDLDLIAWADMLVLTGVTTSYDRMRQLSAYARALHTGVTVVAGGPPVRALPKLSERYFDYVCLGDIEELRDIAAEAFGPEYAAADMFPRYDLMNPSRLLGYVESSRNCNFRCEFCSLTGEGNRYLAYDLEFVRRQILATGKKHIVFIDNNFYGGKRQYFLDRVALLRELKRDGRIEGWSALVTGDFFRNPENLQLAKEAGCFALFSGVESFDQDTLSSYNKRQNQLMPQIEMISSCLDAGILFVYGIMLDPTARHLDDLESEIRFILGTPEITLPSFFTLAIPLIGTPYFRDCFEQGLLLPGLRVRDLDGVTITMRPLDPVDEVVTFARDLLNLRGRRRHLFTHAARFLARYRRSLGPMQLFAAGVGDALIATQTTASGPTRLHFNRQRQTFLAGTEIPDPQYTPAMRLPERYRSYFEPTRIIDAEGGLDEAVMADLMDAPQAPIAASGAAE